MRGRVRAALLAERNPQKTRELLAARGRGAEGGAVRLCSSAVALTALFAGLARDRELFGRVAEAARERTANADPSHDWLHVARVADSVRIIAPEEGADLTVTATAALLHELVSLPKSHPEAHRSAEQCAQVASHLLGRLDAPEELILRVVTCIEEHPFSRGLTPSTRESAVLQDADRLDAIGAIGIARCLATSGMLGRPFYAEADPFCRTREPDDRSFAVDHFYRKLLRIAERLHTPAARRLAEPRMAAMRSWLAQLETELGGTVAG